EPRPCSVVDTATVLSCPGSGDWSWPSNHAVLAAAFATACILVVPRLAWFALPLALAIAASPVAAGVHYVPDVPSGLALGALVVAAVVAAASPVLDRRLTGGRDGHPDSASRSQGGRAWSRSTVSRSATARRPVLTGWGARSAAGPSQ